MSSDWIDEDGFRANVGIILADGDGKLMLGGRVGSKGWQFPQGGVLVDEDPAVAMYRELREEVGLERNDVELLGVSSKSLPTGNVFAMSLSRSTPVSSVATKPVRPGAR